MRKDWVQVIENCCHKNNTRSSSGLEKGAGNHEGDRDGAEEEGDVPEETRGLKVFLFV